MRVDATPPDTGQGSANLPEQHWDEAQDVPVEVSVEDTSGHEVVKAVIRMYVSPAR